MLRVISYILLFLLISISGRYTSAAEWEKLSLQSNYTTSIEMTPKGLFVGENDFSPWVGRHNGIYKSSDLGVTWDKSGLKGTGITDIYYFNDKIYATTQYANENKVGLYVSNDFGQSWEHFSQVNFSSNAVIAEDSTIILGTNNNGLWVSSDYGANWEQKIGTGYYGPKVHEISSSNNLILVTTDNSTYKSLDKGETWQSITELNNKRIRYIEIKDNFLVAGTENNDGVYTSTNKGETWNEINGLSGKSSGAITSFKGKFYIGLTNEENYRSVFQSKDLVNWMDTRLISEGNYTNVKDLEWAYSSPSYIFAATHYDGIYRLAIENNSFESNKMFRIPWEYQTENELLENITAYFDHSYPLLGYKYFQEPEEQKNTTTNFLGLKSMEPDLYYSGHNGTDFGLPLGKEIKATASGYATYYYCKDCGHSIKIDHLNGYETTYMHLQKERLVSISSVPKFVNKGDTIGKVGMTGNTTGPHLHITVTKDQNNNGFIDDFPYGLVDPFGWQTYKFIDPWADFIWQDTLGNHTGTQSRYLWDTDIPYFEKLINPGVSTEIIEDNFKITFPVGVLAEDFVLQIYSYIEPRINNDPILRNGYNYIRNSSRIVRLINAIDYEIHRTKEPVEIQVDFSTMNLNNVIIPTLQIYHFNTDTQNWEPLETKFMDLEKKIIAAETYEFSNFALFGKKLDYIPPETYIQINGNKNEFGWFTEYPEITFTSTDDQTQSNEIDIYYKIGNDIDWVLYENPFSLERAGIFAIEFKSKDISDNWETQKESELLKINSGRYFDTAKVVNVMFQASEL